MSAKGQFTKGRSGNPGGRPALPDDVKEALRSRTLEAVEELWKLCTRARDPKVRLAALTIWLRKVVPDATSVEMSGPEGGPVAVSMSAAADEAFAKLRRVVDAAKARGATTS